MDIERRTIATRETWLEWRRHDVTASTVGALFGVHPYETALRLYTEKCGLFRPQHDSGVLRRGRLLEGVVAELVREQHPEWKVEKATEYFRNPALRLGATPDFFIHGDDRGLGVLQAKTVAPQSFKRHWGDDNPPFWIALQTATEMLLTNAAWGAVAALIVDPYRLDVQLYEIPRHHGVERKIEDAVAQFWDAVAAGREPDPDYGRDSDLLAALYPYEEAAKIVDLSGDNRLPALLYERAVLKEAISKQEARCEAIETELKFKIGDGEIAAIPGWKVTWKTHHRKEYVVPARDVRTLRITEINGR